MFEKILVPLDGSELAEIALEPALRLAEKFNGEVILLRVAEPEEALAEAYLGELCLNKARAGVRLQTEVAAGAPPQAIVEVADARQVDLIIMSTHGRSGLSRLIYGSVAEAVLRGAQRPVMIVPSQFAGSR